MSKKPTIVFAVDCEFSGNDMIKNFIPEFGWWACTLDEVKVCSGHVLCKRMPGELWDPDTVKWMSGAFDPKVRDVMLKSCMARGATEDEVLRFFAGEPRLPECNAPDPGEGLTRFRCVLSSMRDKYDVYVVSDMPENDIGRLNYAISKYTACEAIHMEGGNYHRSSKCTDSFAEGLVRKVSHWVSDQKIADELGFEKPNCADHNPMNDAKAIALKYVRCIKSASVTII